MTLQKWYNCLKGVGLLIAVWGMCKIILLTKRKPHCHPGWYPWRTLSHSHQRPTNNKGIQIHNSAYTSGIGSRSHKLCMIHVYTSSLNPLSIIQLLILNYCYPWFKTIMDLHHLIMNVQLHNASMEIHSFFLSKQIWAIMDIIIQLCLRIMQLWMHIPDLRIFIFGFISGLWIHAWIMNKCIIEVMDMSIIELTKYHKFMNVTCERQVVSKYRWIMIWFCILMAIFDIMG